MPPNRFMLPRIYLGRRKQLTLSQCQLTAPRDSILVEAELTIHALDDVLADPAGKCPTTEKEFDVLDGVPAGQVERDDLADAVNFISQNAG